MGRVGSSLLVTTFASVALAAIAFAGCSADGSSGDEPIVEPTPTDPGQGLQPGTSSGDPAVEQDSGSSKKDASSKDAQADSGPPPPIAGDTCTKLDAIVEKQCGACGKQSTVCLADANGDGGAGGGHWSVYSDCTGELAGGCTPGETSTEACGNCGTHARTCTKYCAWTTSACTGQPVDSCAPGSVDLTAAGCSTANTYHQRSCKADCSYDPFGTTCVAPPTVVNVPPTVGSISSTIAVLTSTKTISKLTGSCPNAVPSTTLTTPYVYIQVTNTLTKPAVVSIYNSVAPGGVVFDTTLASYVGAVSPTTDAARKTCDKGVGTFGNSTLTGDYKFASLDGTRKVTIPAGGTVSVYVAAKKVYDATKPTESTGPVKLSVKTEALD